jgi:hypothetical protein
LFYFFTRYIEQDWDKRRLSSNVTWQTVPAKLKDIRGAFDGILSDFSAYVMQPITDKFFPKPETPPPDAPKPATPPNPTKPHKAE